MEKSQKKIIERVPTGIRGLDELIGGGLVKNSVVLLQGNTGTTKTLFSLQYLYRGAIDYGDPGVFISFSEDVEALYQHAKLFNWDFDDLVEKNKLAIIKYSPHEVATVVSEGGGSIRDTIESMGAKRLVIDSLTAYALFFENKYKANESILDLFEMLRKWNTTTIVTAEVATDIRRFNDSPLGFLTDGIINLYHIRNGNSVVRSLEIVKMRDTHHDERINDFVLDKDGLRLLRK